MIDLTIIALVCLVLALLLYYLTSRIVYETKTLVWYNQMIEQQKLIDYLNGGRQKLIEQGYLYA